MDFIRLNLTAVYQKSNRKHPGGSCATRADNFTYTTAGAVSSMMLGNSKWENAQFNSRLQPTQLGLGTSSTDQSLWKVNYDYGTTDNNGNVKQQTITVPSINPLIQTYAYDALNRLKSAEEMQNSSQTWKQAFTYDRYGNRNFDSANTTTLGSCPAAQCNPTVDTANNRFSSGQGYTYDQSGNVTADAQGRTFVYDAENKQKEVKDSSNNSIGQYLYDGDGKRVKKLASADTTVFAYDASGKLAAEYLLTNSTPNTPQTSYLTNDTLGSPRVITDQSGSIQSRRDFMPFGEEISGLGNRTSAIGYQADSTRQKFTSYEKDNESNLAFAQERYYAKNQGRFTSADPIPMTSQRPSDPQRLNLYAYVRNSPLSNTDKTGLELQATGSEVDRYVKDLESASGLKLELNSKTGKISIVSSPKKLSKEGKQIQKIINDTKNVVKIEAIRDTSGKQQVLVGRFNGNGSQTIDYDDIGKFDKQSGGSTAESIVIHETTEAYEGITNKAALADPKGPFPVSHITAVGYENAYRERNGLGARVEQNQTITRLSNEVVVTIDYTTHREKITIDKANPNQVKSVQVEKKKP